MLACTVNPVGPAVKYGEGFELEHLRGIERKASWKEGIEICGRGNEAGAEASERLRNIGNKSISGCN